MFFDPKKKKDGPADDWEMMTEMDDLDNTTSTTTDFLGIWWRFYP